MPLWIRSSNSPKKNHYFVGRVLIARFMQLSYPCSEIRNEHLCIQNQHFHWGIYIWKHSGKQLSGSAKQMYSFSPTTLVSYMVEKDNILRRLWDFHITYTEFILWKNLNLWIWFQLCFFFFFFSTSLLFLLMGFSLTLIHRWGAGGVKRGKLLSCPTKNINFML